MQVRKHYCSAKDDAGLFIAGIACYWCLVRVVNSQSARGKQTKVTVECSRFKNLWNYILL